MQRSFLSLLLAVCVAFLTTAPSSSLVTASASASNATEDYVATVNNQLAAIKPVTAECSSDAALVWLSSVGEVFTRIATGGLPALPPLAIETVNVLGSQILTSPKNAADVRVVTKAAELLPTMWAMGFWYAKQETWQPVLTSVLSPLIAACKSNSPGFDAAYDTLLNSTSLVIRFTKDNVFLNGVDDGTIPHPANKAYVDWLAQVVASVSKLDGFTLSEPQLRAYMKTLPSKRDGMDKSVAFPVYVDTAKYKASDAEALHAFLAKLPSDSLDQSTQ